MKSDMTLQLCWRPVVQRLAITAILVLATQVLATQVLGFGVSAATLAAAEPAIDHNPIPSNSDLLVVRAAAPLGWNAAGRPSIIVESQAGTKFVAQVGGPWLLDSTASAVPAAPAVPDETEIWLTWIAPRTELGPWSIAASNEVSESTNQLEWSEGPAQDGNVGIELHVDQLPLLRLIAKPYDPTTPETRDETYKVFHHLWLPGLADPITKGTGGLFPHHRGLFLGWNRIGVTQNGITAEVDTWHAKQAHQELTRESVREAGPVYGRQVLVVDWINEATAPPQPFIRETRELIVFPLGDQRLVQFSARLVSLAGEITLAGDPQHAGFQFRAAQQVAELTKEQTYYLRPDGIDQPGSFRNWPDQASHVNLPFHAMSFVLDGQRLTCARLEHSSNPGETRFSERDYGRFGSYFEHRLTTDQPLEIRYQLRILPGETDLKTLEAWQQDFASPAFHEWSLPPAPEPEFPPKLAQALHQMQPLSQTPVFSGAADRWDAVIRERGWIMFDDGQYKMCYTGYDGQRNSIKRLGMATSTDGVSWKRLSPEPLLPNHWIEDMMVVRHRGIYWMFAEGQDDIAQGYRSDDGLKWQPMGALDIRQVDGQPIAPGPRGTPTVLIHGDDWYLFYERRDAGIWLAKAQPSSGNDSAEVNSAEVAAPRQSLPVWQNVQDEPIIGLRDRDYDQTMIALNQIVPVATGYLAMFHSSSDAQAPRNWVCSAAYSPDLLHWVKLDQPLTKVEQNQSSGLLVESPAGWRFYTTHGQVHVYKLPEAIQ